MRNLDYSKDTRYQKIFLTAKLFIPLLKDLIALGYVEEWYGSQTSGLRTRIKATDKLLDLCTEWDIAHVFRAADVPEEETIVLKDERKKPMEYSNTRQTNQMRKTFQRINRRLDETSITIPGFDRADVKKTFLVLFNCESRKKTLSTMRSKKHIKNSAKLLTAIEAAHPAIKDAFYRRANEPSTTVCRFTHCIRSSKQYVQQGDCLSPRP